MDASAIQAALTDVSDMFLLFQGYTDYTRDYELFIWKDAAPKSGIQPTYLRYLFEYCVEAEVRSAISPEGWKESLDDELIESHYVNVSGRIYWGVRYLIFYPGGTVVTDSDRARRWTESVGIDFHEILIETNFQTIKLIAADLHITEVDLGYAPFVIRDE